MNRAILAGYLAERYQWAAHGQLLLIECTSDDSGSYFGESSGSVLASLIPKLKKFQVINACSKPGTDLETETENKRILSGETGKFNLIFLNVREHLKLREMFENALSLLLPGGLILLGNLRPVFIDEAAPHPPDSVSRRKTWLGTAWKSVIDIRAMANVDMAVGDFDWGIGIVLLRTNPIPLEQRATATGTTLTDIQGNPDKFIRDFDQYVPLLSFYELHEWLSDPRGTSRYVRKDL